MRVRNRSGCDVEVSYDKIKERLQELCKRGCGNGSGGHNGVESCALSALPNEAGDHASRVPGCPGCPEWDDMASLDIDEIVIDTIKGIFDGITTAQLDDMSARVCVSLQSKNHAYDTLAGRIVMSNIHKTVGHALSFPKGVHVPFSVKVAYIADRLPGTYHPRFLAFVEKHSARLDAMSDYERDYNYNYFSVRTMEKSYLLKVDDVCIESPQDMWMRVAVAINCGGDAQHRDDRDDRLRSVWACYDMMSRGLFTHATPTLFNAGTRFEQMSSCYLLGTDDSLEGIYDTLADCAQISKWAGGIGIHVSNVRAKGSRIASTNGYSDGIIPMLKVFNETARYCNQSGRRKGSIAVYLEPWHADVFEFVELRKNTGAETLRARDLFLALFVPDIFMRRVVEDGDWYLMSSDACPGLQDVYGQAFDELYCKYVDEGRYMRRVRAKDLWKHILQCQIETGTPYMLYKDNVNTMCNQKNLGTVRSSNLCAEITEYSDSDTYAVCNLASIAVNRFVTGAWSPLKHHVVHVTVGAGDAKKTVPVCKPSPRAGLTYDFDELHRAAKLITINLNRIIDANFYPTPQTRASNMAARPIGIGVQGFADLYCALGLEYDDEAAMQLDAEIMETIYHGALEASVELAVADGPYPKFAGSPFSQGLLQMDLWASEARRRPVRSSAAKRWDWDKLRANVVRHGTRNSMLTALMPTATTAQILGNSEAFEPAHSNVYKRTTLAGEFMVVNKTLMRDMMEAGAWHGVATMQQLIRSDGSVQALEQVPEHIRRLYRTVWELPQKSIMDHAVARAPYVDQSQSMNLFFPTPNSQKLHSALIYAWKSGLKTGMYYLRSKPATEAMKITGTHHSSASSTAATANNTNHGTSTSSSTRRKNHPAAHPPFQHRNTPANTTEDACSIDGSCRLPRTPLPASASESPGSPTPSLSCSTDFVCEMCSS